jgi:hypothetical protein
MGCTLGVDVFAFSRLFHWGYSLLLHTLSLPPVRSPATHSLLHSRRRSPRFPYTLCMFTASYLCWAVTSSWNGVCLWFSPWKKPTGFPRSFGSISFLWRLPTHSFCLPSQKTSHLPVSYVPPVRG